MKDCGYCPFDEQDCDACKIPEFTNDKYRDSCDICQEFIMIPYDVRDRFNLVLCKACAKFEAKDVYEEFNEDEHAHEAIGTFQGVYVEGIDRWWGL